MKFNVIVSTLLISLPSLLPLLSQANSNEIVLASTHDVQEVDVSTLVAVQPYTWIGEDFDKESRRSDSWRKMNPQRNNLNALYPQTADISKRNRL